MNALINDKQFLDAHHTGVVYPHAISLIQSVRDYQITHAMVVERPGADMLVASLRKELHNAFLAVSDSNVDNLK